jgi:hypothetical protein
MGHATVSNARGDRIVSRESSIQAFRKAVKLLRTIDADLTLYVASDTFCLMHGPSHDDHGQPRKMSILDTESSLRISGGDW